MNSCFGPFHHGIFGSRSSAQRRSCSSTSSSTSPISSSTSSSKANRRSEVIQDLDIYFIRQIAQSLQEYDLEQKIDLEIKMQEGTTKLLAACKHQLQALEAAKSLLTSNERMNSYMFELQKRKAHQRRIKNDLPIQNPVNPSKAKVAVTDIRMPLIWKDSDHFKNRGDYRRFAVFCLLKIGTEIYDSVMINNVDRSMTDIAFEDVIVFNHIPPDFEFHLEVYSHVLQDDLSMASASNKLKKKISYSVSRTIGKKLAASMKDELNTNDIGPKFDLVAHATLRLEDTNARIKTYDFIIENLEKQNHQLPLFGHFCCRMAVQPECMTEERYSGYLSLVQQVGNITGSRRMWSTLKNFVLSMWANPAETHRSQPDVVITVKKGTKVLNDTSPVSYPSLSFKITNPGEGDKPEELMLAAESGTELSRWIAQINQHIQDYDLWKPATDSLMEIPSPSPCRNSVFLRNRNSSLYDETPFPDCAEPSSPAYGAVFLENSHRLSSPSFRSRSSSSSSTSSSIGSNKQQISIFRRSTCRDLTFY